MFIVAFAIMLVDGYPNVCESNVGGWAGTGLGGGLAAWVSESGEALGKPGGVGGGRAGTLVGAGLSAWVSESGGALGEPGGVGGCMAHWKVSVELSQDELNEEQWEWWS